MKESTRILLRAGIIRALRTFAETSLAALGTIGITSNLPTWGTLGAALSTGLIAAIISVLWSLKGLPETADKVNTAKKVEAAEAAQIKAEEAQQKADAALEVVKTIELTKAQEIEEAKREAMAIATEAAEDAAIAMKEAHDANAEAREATSHLKEEQA